MATSIRTETPGGWASVQEPTGKSLTPPPGGSDSPSTTRSRRVRRPGCGGGGGSQDRVQGRELSRHDHFDDVSPEVGILDEDAFADAFEEDLDEALAMLAELIGATDRDWLELARQLAGRIMIGAARIGSQPQRRRTADVATACATTRVTSIWTPRSTHSPRPLRGSSLTPAELYVTTWDRPSTAVCLLVDRSGSMAGDRLASAGVAAAAITYRAPLDCSVVCFSDRSVVVKAQDETRSADVVVADVLSLRGFGITDVGLALRTAGPPARTVRCRAPRSPF